MLIMHGPRGPEACPELKDLLHPVFVLSVTIQCKRQQHPIVPLVDDAIFFEHLTYEEWKKNKKSF